MSLVWVPFCARIVCHVSIVTNIILLLLPYQQYQMWVYRDAVVQPFLVNGTWQKVLASFGALWITFVGVRFFAVAASRRGVLVPLCRRMSMDGGGQSPMSNEGAGAAEYIWAESQVSLDFAVAKPEAAVGSRTDPQTALDSI